MKELNACKNSPSFYCISTNNSRIVSSIYFITSHFQWHSILWNFVLVDYNLLPFRFNFGVQSNSLWIVATVYGTHFARHRFWYIKFFFLFCLALHCYRACSVSIIFILSNWVCVCVCVYWVPFCNSFQRLERFVVHSNYTIYQLQL